MSALPGAVVPPAKYHEGEVVEAHGEVLQPLAPDTTWFTATPPPSKANEVARSPVARPAPGLTAAWPRAGTTRSRWTGAPGVPELAAPLPVPGATWEVITAWTSTGDTLVRKMVVPATPSGPAAPPVQRAEDA